METTKIQMIRDKAKSSSLKGTDVFRSTDPNSIITNVYVKKSINSTDQILLTVEDFG